MTDSPRFVFPRCEACAAAGNHQAYSSILASSFKINPQLKDRPRITTCSYRGWHSIKAERDASPRNTHHSGIQGPCHDPLHIYFNVLMNQLIASGNQASLINFAPLGESIFQAFTTLVRADTMTMPLLHQRYSKESDGDRI